MLEIIQWAMFVVLLLVTACLTFLLVRWTWTEIKVFSAHKTNKTVPEKSKTSTKGIVILFIVILILGITVYLVIAQKATFGVLPFLIAVLIFLMLQRTSAKKKIQRPLWHQIIRGILFGLLFSAILLTPYVNDTAMDGGTQEIRAVGYAVVKWNGYNRSEHEPKVYPFPLSFLDIDTLREQY